jgi:hypothetical protein
MREFECVCRKGDFMILHLLASMNLEVIFFFFFFSTLASVPHVHALELATRSHIHAELRARRPTSN